MPITGEYAITCYKSQSATFRNIIIDLAEVTADASAYVMLSRGTNGERIKILREFPWIFQPSECFSTNTDTSPLQCSLKHFIMGFKDCLIHDIAVPVNFTPLPTFPSYSVMIVDTRSILSTPVLFCPILPLNKFFLLAPRLAYYPT